MAASDMKSEALTTLGTLVVGAIGAGLGYWLGFPVYLLTGPAILVATLALFGMRFGILPPLWNAALLVIGLRIGAGVTNEATAALIRWPLAFLALAVMLAAIMVLSRFLLTRLFDMSARSAVLSSTPGHLSFVLSLGADMGADLPRIATVQSVRLLTLTLLVPFGARAWGIEFVPGATAVQVMPIAQFAMLAALGLAAGLGLRWLRVPAPMLIGGMVVSSLAHVSDLVPGALSPLVAVPGFVVVGTMIGSRFSGLSLAQLRRDGLAGLVITCLAAGLATLTAIPVAAFLGVPVLHVLVAFAPGGLETMVVIGSALGANPGFVAASHVARLFILLFLMPLMLGQKAEAARKIEGQ